MCIGQVLFFFLEIHFDFLKCSILLLLSSIPLYAMHAHAHDS